MEPKSDSMAEEYGELSLGCEGEEVSVVGNSNKKTIGVLEVYIHQARDIHNICIYHNQDVYAKIFLTDDPEQAASTQIVNRGGKNPVFNENLWVNVRTIKCSLRCEIWMMSRIKNYLEDQLLGFALVPLCDVVAGNGKASGEFALSSCDLFHSPAGFVQMTARYIGALPLGPHMDAPTPANFSGVADVVDGGGDRGISNNVVCELEKIEFPDPKIMNENEMMVSEYLERNSGVADVGGSGHKTPSSVPVKLEKIECSNSKFINGNEMMISNYLERPCLSKGADSSEKDLNCLNMRSEVKTGAYTTTPFSLSCSGLESQTSEKIGSATANVDQTCAGSNLDGITQVQEVQTPHLSVPTDESAPLSIPQATHATQPTCQIARAPKSPSEEDVSSPSRGNTIKAKGTEESISAATLISSKFAATPLISVSAVPEQRVVQHEIIDMYTKSMQQFTETLAKMKLPMDIERETNTQNGKADSKSGNTVEKDMEPKCSKSTRVFYGSRAFF